MARIYIDTSVVIAVTNPLDSFYGKSLKFLRGLQEVGVAYVTGPPILLEVGKAVQRRGVGSALEILRAMQTYDIEVAVLDSSQLLNLSDLYVAHKVTRRYRFDLLHYAAATLLNCSHLASWDREHFNESTERRVNRVNSLTGLATLKVGDPIKLARSLGFG